MLEGFDGGECGERMCGTCGAGHTHGGGAAGETGTGDAVTGVNIGAAEMFFAFGLEFGEREIICAGFCTRILSEKSGAGGSCCDGQRGDKGATAQMALQSQS